MDAFDSDVLIYAAVPGHALGRRVLALFPDDEPASGGAFGVGSVLLLAELLAKPLREGRLDEQSTLVALLARLDLRPVDPTIARAAVSVGATYGLRAADAVHLATAIVVGADRFITNTTRDFTAAITEIEIVSPADLPDDGPAT